MEEDNKKCTWDVLCVINDENDYNDPQHVFEFYSCGLCNIGLPEIVVGGTMDNSAKIVDLINCIAQMLVDGDFFSPTCGHIIDDKDGNEQFKFDVSYGLYNDGTGWMQVIPDFDPHILNIRADYFDRRV